MGGTETAGECRGGCGSVEAVAGRVEAEGCAEDDEGCGCVAGVDVGVVETVEGG